MQKIEKLNDYSELKTSVKNLLAIFSNMGITQSTFSHPAIYTIEEGLQLDLPRYIPGQHGKSLFLKDALGQLWLVVVCEDKRVDLKKLALEMNCKRFSFASPALMQEILGVTPGSATPFALINDTTRQVRVVIDQDFRETRECTFHPLLNTYSTIIAFDDLLKFLGHLGYDPHLTAVT